MPDLAIALIGVAAGGGANLAVHLYTRRIDERRARRTAARILYHELMEIGDVEINAGRVSRRAIEHLHDLWRERRAALGALSSEAWCAIEAAVFDRARPDVIGPQPPDSHDNRLELALIALEEAAEIPQLRRAFPLRDAWLVRVRHAGRRLAERMRGGPAPDGIPF